MNLYYFMSIIIFVTISDHSHRLGLQSGIVVAVPIPETQAASVISLQTAQDQAICEGMYVFM